jgi:uncharacterized protein YjbI with pentapeptide repeats
MADPEHLAQLKQGVEAWNRWRDENREIIPDIRINPNLRGADLTQADLTGADLSEVDLTGTDLDGAILVGTDLTGADLNIAFLRDADLRGARLGDANLSNALLFGANLEETWLVGANFDGAALSGANFHRAVFKSTRFGDVDLSEVRGLETSEHGGPSSIGIDTLYRSNGNMALQAQTLENLRLAVSP